MNYQLIRQLQVYVLHCKTHSSEQCHECQTCTDFALRDWTFYSCPFCKFRISAIDFLHLRTHACIPRPQLIRHLMRSSNKYVEFQRTAEDIQNKRLIEYLGNRRVSNDPRDLIVHNFRTFLVNGKITSCFFCLEECPENLITHLNKHLSPLNPNLRTSYKNISEEIESFQTHCSLSHANEMSTFAESYLARLQAEAKRQNGHALFFTISELASDNDKLKVFCKDPPYDKCSCCRFFKAKIFFQYFLSGLLRVVGDAARFDCILDDCGESFSSLNMLIRHFIFSHSDKDREKKQFTPWGKDALPICVLYAKHTRGHATTSLDFKITCLQCQKLLSALKKCTYSAYCPVCSCRIMSGEALLDHFAIVHGPSIPKKETLTEGEMDMLVPLSVRRIKRPPKIAKEVVKSQPEVLKPKQPAPLPASHKRAIKIAKEEMKSKPEEIKPKPPAPEPTTVSPLQETTSFEIMTEIGKHSQDHHPAFFYPNCPRCSGHFSRFLTLSRKSRVVDDCVVCPACHALFRLFFDLYKHWMAEHFIVLPNKNANKVNDPPKKDDSWVPNVDPAVENAIEMIVGHKLVDSATFFVVD